MNNSQSNSEINDKIRSYFLKEYNVTFTDAEMIEVRQSMYHLGKAIAQYVVLQEQKRNTKTLEDR